MTYSAREMLARVVDLFGPPATANPTVLYGNLTVSPGGNVLCGTTSDDGTNKLQVNGPSKFYGSITANGNFSNSGYTVTASQFSSVLGEFTSTANGLIGTGVFHCTGDLGTSWTEWDESAGVGVQMDCPNSEAAYYGIRWTRWGGRHLATIACYEGGSTTTTPEIAFLLNSNVNPQFVFYDGGSATFAGALTQNSDYRIKTNLEAIEPTFALTQVLTLKPTLYDRTDYENQGRQVGFIAHEMQESFPLLVKGEKDATKIAPRYLEARTPYRRGEEPDDYVKPQPQDSEVPDLQSVNYVGLIPYLVASIQALNQKVDAQAKLIAQLQGESNGNT